jgi:hypothetical protein
VGTSFECTEIASLPTGWKVRYALTFEAEAAAAIDTPAGRFETLRLVASGLANNETNGSVSGR